MKCPVCENTNLLMSERQGIEIDYCPQCRGVWLDRGELDKIIERSGVAAPAATSDGRAAVPAVPAYPAQAAPQAMPQQQQHQQAYPQPTQHYSSQHKHQSSHTYPQHHHGGHYKKKKEGFLSDLFDFD